MKALKITRRKTKKKIKRDRVRKVLMLISILKSREKETKKQGGK